MFILPLRDVPQPDESFMGYVLRMSNWNGLSGIYWLYLLLGRERLNRFEYEDIDPIAEIFGCDPKILKMKFVAPIRDNGMRMYSAHGHQMKKPYLMRHLRPQCCPICIGNFGRSGLLWDFSLISVCQIHRCKLIDECPQCQQKMKWSRPRMIGCKCGMLWEHVDVVFLSSDDPSLQFSSMISERLLHSTEQVLRKLSLVETLISSLSLDTTFRLIWSLGIRRSPDHFVSTGISKTVLRTEQAYATTARAFHRLMALVEHSADQPRIIPPDIHLPSLFTLAKDVSSLEDCQFVGSLLQRLGSSNRSSTTLSPLNSGQLVLF